MRWWLMASVVVAAGCAGRSAAVAPPQPGPEVTEEVVEWERSVDRSSLERAEEALKEGRLGQATVIADSLYGEWLGLSALDARTAEDFADLLDSVGAEDRAAHVLLRAPFDLDRGARNRLRRLASELSIAELESLLRDEDGGAEARLILGAENARALALAGHADRARQLAGKVLEGGPEGAEREKAEDVLQGKFAPITEPVRIGVVVPASGRFAAVGEQILEGALLALAAYESDPGRSPVDLVVLDDSSRVDLAIGHVESLERSGVVAVLGPVRSEALVSSAIRRDRDDLTVVSPTAATGQGAQPNAFTLWDRDRREADVAGAMVSWLADEMDLRAFGVLHPEGWSPTALETIRVRAGDRGGRVVAAEAYPTDSTTFGDPISALAQAEPEAVLVFADGARTVLQLAPQLVYYGLRRWVIAGDANWSDPTVVRQLDPSYADHRIVGTFLDRLSPDTPWKDFQARYEAHYRKALPDNMFAALGFDAMGMILGGVPEAEAQRRGAVGRSIRRGVHAGATGNLSVDPSSGELRREVFVKVIRDGSLEVPDPDEMTAWAQQQLELEEFLRALEEEKEKAKEEGGSGS